MEETDQQNDLNSLLPFVFYGYKFVRRIGAGAYSEVFEVISLQYKEIFAAKVTPVTQSMLDTQGQLIDTELLILTSIIDPNILKVFNYFIAEGYLIIILEYCPGGTVLDWMQTHKHFPIDSLAKFTEVVSHSLGECHKLNIAHRDIKPANIFIDKYGRPKVGDFGLSSILSKTDDRVKSAKGTEYFAAPEIFRNEDYDPFKADVYALGVTLFQMATGRLPWNEGSRAGTPIDFPPDFNPKLKALIQQMTDLNPINRPNMQDIPNSEFCKTCQHKPTPIFNKLHKPEMINRRSSAALSQMLSARSPGMKSQDIMSVSKRHVAPLVPIGAARRVSSSRFNTEKHDTFIFD